MLSLISSRRRLTAWFGLLAIWLLVLMPLASQLAEAAAAHRPAAPICAATQHADRHELPRDALSAFGYCDLLASHAYAPAAAALADALLHPLVHRALLPAPALPPRFSPSLAAPARAPPSLA